MNRCATKQLNKTNSLIQELPCYDDIDALLQDRRNKICQGHKNPEENYIKADAISKLCLKKIMPALLY